MTKYNYNSNEPIKIKLADCSDKERFYLSESKTFCIYPWIHLHAYPSGEAWPCCSAEMAVGPVGNCRTDDLSTIWHNEKMQKLRSDMLNETPNKYCTRCYEQEKSGFFSLRQSANKHHGHHIAKIHQGVDPAFEMTYWDIRFSNLCNLKCRSCGHIFSSSWYQDQQKLIDNHIVRSYERVADPSWPTITSAADINTLPARIKDECINVHRLIPSYKSEGALSYAGRGETDIWEQLEPQLDYVEQIYFAGGEPLLMIEHYKILEELERRGRFDVRLIYNTNFTETKLKDRSVFDYWKKFENVSVGASLDAMGPRAEYIRKGTKWDQIMRNREEMLKICPQTDFYVSPTLSILNAWHITDFHRDWVDRGFLKAQDLNVNILQDPVHYRIDIAPMKFKQRLRMKYEEHLEWLRPLDHLCRATVGFESAIKYMMATDNTALLDLFWQKTNELDTIRSESLLQVIPELEALNHADPK